MEERDGGDMRAWILSLVLALTWGGVWSGCSAEPTKSQYVSAVVRAECAGLRGTEAQGCRVAVIKRFSKVPLEEMKAKYPAPAPPDRPSCSL